MGCRPPQEPASCCCGRTLSSCRTLTGGARNPRAALATDAMLTPSTCCEQLVNTFPWLICGRRVIGVDACDRGTSRVGRRRAVQTGFTCGFNRWVQHLNSEYREEDVVYEAATKDLLQRSP